MARRKSVCAKWTLIFLVVILCPFVYSRPSDTLSTDISSITKSVQTNKPTENPIRYRYRQSNHSLDKFKLPIVIGFVNGSLKDSIPNINSTLIKNNSSNVDLFFNFEPDGYEDRNSASRRHRMITKTVIIGGTRNNSIKKKKPVRREEQESTKSEEIKRPTIRKVITKWTDKTKVEDLNFSYESSTSNENKGDTVAFTNSLSLEDYISTENIIDESSPNEKRPHPHYPNKFYNKLQSNKHYRPDIENEENLGVVHSNKVHIIEYPYPSVRPAYVFTTPRPTPIITNVGNPKPWSPYQNVKKKPTQKPVHKNPLKDQYNYHNNAHNYPQFPDDNFEVTTFQPSNAYTERIVIRPEEYSASNYDCPTIYLTLNNTFQGQGKEACPDLNIAVNTNVVNKNVVVDSEEDDTDSIFPGGFGLPLGEDSGAEDAEGTPNNSDYFDSDENEEQAESASVEATGLSNYNANLQADSSEPGGGGGSHNAALAGGKPGRPPDDDDTFSFSGMMSFFKPAINALTWLAAINPFSFTIVSMLLTPLAMLMAGYSGVAALFAPLGLAREASPKIVHVYRPKWEWDDKYKTWYFNSFPNNRKWRPATERLPRNSKEIETEFESVRPTLFYKIKEWMKNVIKILRDKEKVIKSVQNTRKNKRRKRETWTRRVK